MYNFQFTGRLKLEMELKDIEEFGCNLNHYNPYENGGKPDFRDEKVSCF